MIVENPLALAYILPGDVYVLPADKQQFAIADETIATPELIAADIEIAPVLIAEEPAIIYTEPEKPIEQTVAIPQIPAIAPPVIPAVSETPAAPFKYHGGNQKNFLVLVSYPDYDIMEPAHLTALESTVKRKGMAMDDVAVLNVAQYGQAQFKDIEAYFKPQRLLLMGKTALPLNMPVPAPNQLVKQGVCDMVFTFSFAGMMGNKDRTKVFWDLVKTL
jgi:hypothetical protein